LISAHADGYLDWLKTIHEETHGNSDLIAHFFRRAFNLMRPNGCFGLIATNTIAQGDTRSTGLRWICTHGGTIYCARKRVKWPGKAAVVVSVVHLYRGAIEGPYLLDNRAVPVITAYLFHGGGHESPNTLFANHDKSFIGNYINGAGFTFDDSNPQASPISEMHRLIAQNARNQERIFPYIGGEEILNHPEHLPHRYVINFGAMTENEARTWPDLMAVVEEKVKPYRLNQSDKASRDQWWLFARRGGALQRACQNLERVLVPPNLSNHLSFAFVPRNIVVGAPHNILVFDQHWAFAVLQSRVHELWARFFASSMKDDLRYTPSDCFETFPFPAACEKNDSLEQAGKQYYAFRANLMFHINQGLTKTYNRFHDPDECSPDIVKLRELQAAMDRTVLDAYGWREIPSHCEFLLDYEIDEEEWGNKRKPWRYRWPEEVRDEVLARLLELNAQRAKDEARSGEAAVKKRGKKAGAKSMPEVPEVENLFS
jgi:hypothetical protein